MTDSEAIAQVNAMKATAISYRSGQISNMLIDISKL